MAPVSKKNLDRKITVRLPRRCPRQVERRIIADYSDFTGSFAFTATGQLRTRAALVNANWRGWHAALIRTDKCGRRSERVMEALIPGPREHGNGWGKPIFEVVIGTDLRVPSHRTVLLVPARFWLWQLFNSGLLHSGTRDSIN